MNTMDKPRSTLRTWGPVGLVAIAGTAAVAGLLAAVLSAPSYSDDGPHTPLSTDHDAPAYCFMGRDDWPRQLAVEPPCRR